MSLPEEEQVLVVPRELFDSCGAFNGLNFDVDNYIPSLLSPENYFFEPRATAEEDPSLKQIIPYFIVTHEDKVWCYVRGSGGGEGRLKSKASIGIGGHINDIDDTAEGNTYDLGAERELNEELVVPEGYTHKIVALLNDDSNPVGQVHLGVVHVLISPSADVRTNEDVITDACFRSREELAELDDIMETWSKICCADLDRLLAAAQ